MKAFSHENSPDGKEERLTDPTIIRSLGSFDLDPCASVVRPWNTAAHHYTILDNGLSLPWFGRVWANPPYGRKTGFFLRLLARHGNGIALVYARTETGFFFESIWNHADALFFFKGRLQFFNTDGTPITNPKTNKPEKAPAPSVLVAYGPNNVNALKSLKFQGKFIPLK